MRWRVARSTRHMRTPCTTVALKSCFTSFLRIAQVYLKAYGPNHAETEDAASRAAAMAELIGVELERKSANAAA